MLRKASRRWSFWALVLTFWVCGWSTNGIIQTHFVPAAHDHGMPSTTAAGLLAVVGIFDIVGTVGSGWLTDRVDPRWLLVAYYGGRGLSLLALDAVLAPGIEPGMWVFIVFYGLDWVATVPPTVALCRIHFGLADSGVVFGWVFAVAHGRRGGRRQRRRVGAHQPGRLPLGLGGGGRAVLRLGGDHPVDPEDPRGNGRRGRGGQPTRVTTPVASACRASLASLSGSVASTSWAWRATAYVCSRATAHGPVGAQQAERLGEQRVVVEVAGEQLAAGGRRRGRPEREHVQHRQRALALAQVGARASCRSRRPRTRCR